MATGDVCGTRGEWVGRVGWVEWGGVGRGLWERLRRGWKSEAQVGPSLSLSLSRSLPPVASHNTPLWGFGVLIGHAVVPLRPGQCIKRRGSFTACGGVGGWCGFPCHKACVLRSPKGGRIKEQKKTAGPYARALYTPLGLPLGRAQGTQRKASHAHKATRANMLRAGTRSPSGKSAMHSKLPSPLVSSSL